MSRFGFGKLVAILACALISVALLGQDAKKSPPPETKSTPRANNARTPRDEADLRYWLENMVWHHRFSTEEIAAATGLSADAIKMAQARLNITPDSKPQRPIDPPLLVLPYPGGRHPRLGFLDGAIDPQRETKLSIFTPWDDSSYVVLDVPEAVWSNLGLTYLAHTHVDTVWTKQGVTLPKLEWRRFPDGTYAQQRTLPNGIAFGVEAIPQRDHLAVRMWLHNGTQQPLSGMRVQMCAMLGHARGFEAQTRDNKVLSPPFAAAKSVDGKRWVIHGWQPIQRAWDNPPCPCIHADPQIPDCAPGQTREVHGWLSFYQGEDIKAEFERIKNVWRPLERVALEGRIVDADTKAILPGRLYIEGADHTWHFAETASPEGSAIRYDKKNWINANAVERHTTLSAHKFRAMLPPGRYVVTAERGKEYAPTTREIEVNAQTGVVELPLKRWINMAEFGWYSGDTHVHRTLAELPNLVLAEDLNVAFPFTYWVTQAFAPPSHGDRTLTQDAAAPAELIRVDDTHVIWPRNTEWEIFSINGRPHTLGAIFAINHKTPFSAGIPPVAPIVEQARREGALFDMDKHDWPFALTLPPLLGGTLYELANNHMWRTEFGFTKWNAPAAPWMGLSGDVAQGTERDWMEYTHRTYWALLDCGHRLNPTAGTATGVHPVPLGFGRVYVHLPNGFSYDGWLKGLAAGKSFVTTGPMLFCERRENAIQGRVVSAQESVDVELIVNGQITETFACKGTRNSQSGFESSFEREVKANGTHWVAVRVWEKLPGKSDVDRWRFAHSAPIWRDVSDQKLHPRKEEVEFLAQRVRDELARSRSVLPEAAVKEYETALNSYETAISAAK